MAYLKILNVVNSYFWDATSFLISKKTILKGIVLAYRCNLEKDENNFYLFRIDLLSLEVDEKKKLYM
ncbi:hypothetical protein BHL37_27970 [Bacillus cereus]|nr:hypothetical protein BHL37_27970 [Bacillus cereus]